MSDQTAPQWFKSSYSGSPNNECVECSTSTSALVLVRDSKSKSGPACAFGRPAWAAFLGFLRSSS